MSWHYLQGQEEASWAGGCLTGAPSALLSLIPTHGGSYSPGSETGCLSPSPSGMTSPPLTGDHGEGASMSSAGGSPARTSAAQAHAMASTASGQGSGERWRASFARYGRATSSWKTVQCSLLGDSDEFSETWPAWGSMQSGECSERGMPVLRTRETASGSLRCPTPAATDWKGSSKAGQRRGQLTDPAMGVIPPGGKLNPQWVAWLMGWPIGWTGLEPLEMDRFQQWLRSHGASCDSEGGGDGRQV